MMSGRILLPVKKILQHFVSFPFVEEDGFIGGLQDDEFKDEEDIEDIEDIEEEDECSLLFGRRLFWV
jgi:hypothetical protein